MNKCLLLSCLALFSMCATLSSGAVVTVTVDDNTATANSYTNGSGGHWSGSDALKQVLTKINADATASITLYDIQVIDSDSSGTTYVGDLTIGKPNVTIRQMPNGRGNDTTVTLRSDLSISGGNKGMVYVNGKAGFQLIGLSPQVRFQLLSHANTHANDPIISINTNGCRNCLIQNCKLLGSGAPFYHQGLYTQIIDTDWVDYTISPNCHIEGGTNSYSPSIATYQPCLTFTRCRFLPQPTFNINILTINNWTPFVFNNCYLRIGTATQFFGANRMNKITFNNCTFDTRGQATAIIASGNVPYEGQDAANAGCHYAPTYTFTNPVITTAANSATALFNYATTNNPTTTTIAGLSATSKADLTGARAGQSPCPLLAVRKGTVNLTDCILDDPVVCTSASQGNVSNPAIVAFNLDRCLVKSSLGCTTSPAVVRQFNATNTIFQNPGTTSSLFLANSNGASSAVLTHCTFYGNGGTGARFINADTGCQVRADYSIFNTAAGLNVANAGAFAGTCNVVYGPGTLGAASNSLTNTVAKDPLLDANGHLQVGTSAASAAVGSPSTMDFDGDVRPLGKPGDQPDIGADETNLVPVELSRFRIE